MKKNLKKAVALLMTFALIFGVMPLTQVQAKAATTVTLEVLPGDGYISLLERYADVLPVEWEWQDLENACGGRRLDPGPLQVQVSGSGTSTTVTTPTTPNVSSTVTVQVLPGDGYWAVFVRNRSKFPSNWGWQDLEQACGGRRLDPGPLQVQVSGTGSTTVTTPTTPNVSSTVTVQVLPGDGYWAVFTRNRSAFPASWSWKDLENACGGRRLDPGSLQVNIGASTSSRRPAPGTILGSVSKVNWCDEKSQHNIETAVAVLDGQVVRAGGEFNWWVNVGSCTSWPYVEAPTTNGKATGGGICYPSTLLYQAAVLKAGLKELERHNHYPDRPIWYAEWEEDAAISWGTKNMRFLNDSGVDIRIDTEFNEETRELTISIVAL